MDGEEEDESVELLNRTGQFISTEERGARETQLRLKRRMGELTCCTTSKRFLMIRCIYK
jgi:hypothetical protein